MILVGDTTDVGGEVVGLGGGCPPLEGNQTSGREGRAGRDKYKYVTISDRS